jgi:hypothetical protein
MVIGEAPLIFRPSPQRWIGGAEHVNYPANDGGFEMARIVSPGHVGSFAQLENVASKARKSCKMRTHVFVESFEWFGITLFAKVFE